MSDKSRRHVLHAMGWGMVLSALSLPVRLGARDLAVAFPAQPIRLTRTLERSLGTSASIVATRTWECRFVPLESGALIEGHQVSVAVDAPKQLGALAEVERRRKISGLFPMTLDRAGRIADWSPANASLDEAIGQARLAIERKALEQASEADAKRYVAEIGKTAASLVSQVPRDLLFPETGTRREEQMLPLPDGGKGSYELVISASARPQDGLLERSERRIVTRISDSVRISRETWTIS